MKKFMLGTLIMITGLFTLAVAAQAQTGAVVVHIDQDFVAGRQTLPAGTYKLSQSSERTGRVLILRDQESGESTFLLPSTHNSSATGPLQVKLTRVGDVYFLSDLVTELGAYTFNPPRTLTRTAKVNDGAAVSGSN